MLSTTIFVDGLSHETPNWEDLQNPPTKVTKPQTSITINAAVTVNSGVPFTPVAPTAPTGPYASRPGYGQSSGPAFPQIKNS